MSIISILELAGVAHLPRSQQLIESVILVEGYREAQVEFGSVAGEEQAKQTIDQFRDLVNRNQVQGNERNIDHWRKQGWDQFSAFVQEKSQKRSKNQVKRSKVEGRSIVLHEDRNWLIVVPLDKDASCFHGKNTDWCTTKPFAAHFEEYFYDREVDLIYCLQLTTGNKWAIAAHKKLPDKVEMFDINDRPINAHQFQQQTGLDPFTFIKQVHGDTNIQQQLNDVRLLYNQVKTRVVGQLPFTKVDPKLESDLLFLKNIQLLLQYCDQVKGKWHEAELIFLRNPSAALEYSMSILGTRWPEAEKIISSDAKTALSYARDVLGTRFPEAESTLVKDSRFGTSYACDVVGARWPEFEEVQSKQISDLAKADPRNNRRKIMMMQDHLEDYREFFGDFDWPALDDF